MVVVAAASNDTTSTVVDFIVSFTFQVWQQLQKFRFVKGMGLEPKIKWWQRLQSIEEVVTACWLLRRRTSRLRRCTCRGLGVIVTTLFLQSLYVTIGMCAYRKDGDVVNVSHVRSLNALWVVGFELQLQYKYAVV